MGSEARQSQVWWIGICAGAVAAVLGCGERTPECQGPRCAELDVHVFTWWPATNNNPAAPLEEEAEDKPGVADVRLRYGATKGSMMATVERTLLHADGAERVDTFLANAGRDVLRWTACGGEGSSERLLQLDGPGGYEDLTSRFAPEVLAGVTCCPAQSGCDQPGIYALPLGLHRINHIVYNLARFEACPVQVETSESFVALLRCLSDGGKRVISMPMAECAAPCAEGDAGCAECPGVAGESISYLLENLMLLIGDPTAYQSFWRGQSGPSGDELQRAEPLHAALELLEGQVLPFLNNCGSASDGSCLPVPRKPNDALKEVISGDAAFLVMPDWVMLGAQQDGDGIVDGMIFPGTEGTFLFMTDVFSIPVASTPGTSIEAGFRWLDTLLDPGLQHRFAHQKHATAALADHSQQRLLPALEAQLPASVDPGRIRANLHEWLHGRQSGAAAPALHELMAREFAEAERQGTLRVAPCDHTPCGKR